MPRLLKYVESGGLHFVSSRTEDGLPFSNRVNFEPIFCSILARAQELYPTKISAFYFGGNQLHLLLVPIDTADYVKFVGYVKQESAHIANRLSGRRRKTVWCEGYDSPILLGSSEALYYHAYLYCQAQEAYLVDKIEDYKGANSWKMFVEARYTRVCKRLNRTDFDTHGYHKPERKEEPKAEPELVLTIDPYCWVERLAPGETPGSIKAKIIDNVRTREREIRAERIKNNIKLNSLKVSPELAARYIPKKFGKRMYCICWDIAYRKKFIAWIKEQVALCKEAFQQWKSGDRTVNWPLGFFAPSMPKVASLLPVSLNL